MINKKRGLIVACILLVFVLSTNSNAFEYDISLPKEVYQEGETLQAEIFFQTLPEEEITISQISLKNLKNESIPLSKSLTKISDNHYFLFFPVPKTISGTYTLTIEDIIYKQEKKLKTTTIQKEISLTSVHLGFEELLTNQKNEGYFGSVNEDTLTFISSLALKNTYPEKSKKAYDYFFENMYTFPGCLPKGECTAEETAYALYAYDKFGIKNITLPLNWIKGSQNLFNLGEWKLEVESQNTQCTFNGNEFILDRDEITIPINTTEISLSCTSAPLINLIHIYENHEYTIKSSNLETEFDYEINNQGCWGANYKSECSCNSTAYALWILNKFNQPVPEKEWLLENCNQEDVYHQALLYSAVKNEDAYNFIKNKADSFIDSEKNIKALSLFANSLQKEDNLLQKIQENIWAKTNSLSPKALSVILSTLYSEQTPLNYITATPGIVHLKNSFTLFILNKGEEKNLTFSAPNFTNLPEQIPITNEKEFRISIPNNEKSFNIIITSSSNEFTLPVITSYTEDSTAPENETEEKNLLETTPLLPPPKDAITLLTPSENLTIEISPQNKKLSFKFKNDWAHTLENLTIGFGGELLYALINPQYIIPSLDSEEIHEHIFEIKHPLERESFTGTIKIASSKKTETILHLTLLKSSSESSQEEISLETFGQEEISEEEPEDESTDSRESILQKEAKSDSPKIFTIILISFIIIAIILFFIFSRKKILKKESFENYTSNLKK